MRETYSLILCLGVLFAGARAQDQPNGGEATQRQHQPSSWTFDASLYAYVVPDDRNFLMPMFCADRNWLHLEARYNYEDLETVSAWIGYNAGLEGEFTFTITAMFGGVFGNTSGIAPGFRLGLDWWWLSFSSEGEVVLDLDERANSFLYAWSELTIAPVDWFYAGLVGQRTRVYQTELAIQRGFLAGLHFGPWTVAGYYFNPDLETPTIVAAVEMEF